jgi:hypothetical protein
MGRLGYVELSKDNESGIRSMGISQEQVRARERSANFFSSGLPHIVISKSLKFRISLRREHGRWQIASSLVGKVVI